MLWTAPRRERKFVIGIVSLGASRWPPQIVIRYAPTSAPMQTDLKTRKPVQLLGSADFAAFPIWEYADDEEGAKGRDETWVRPVDSATIPRHSYTHAAADFTTASGQQLSGCVTVSTLDANPEVCQGAIFHDEKALFVSNPEAFGFRESRNELLKALGSLGKTGLPVEVPASGTTHRQRRNHS